MVLKWVIEHWILPSLQYPYGTWGYWYRRYVAANDMAVSVAFRCYDFESFRGYLKNMQALTKKHREIVTQDEADFQHDMKWIWFLKSLVLNGRKSDSRTPQGRCQKWESHIKSLPSWNSVKRCTMKSKDSGEAILAVVLQQGSKGDAREPREWTEKVVGTR